jgi:hypothetical protein
MNCVLRTNRRGEWFIMVSQAALRGYLLEEVIARLLCASGYRLLVHEDQDPVELANGRHGLLVRGRGSVHQADVLGEFFYTPAFSLPIRLFVEAKYRNHPTGLLDVRNAHGVVHDVNENYSTDPRSGRLRRRYHYAYALFSAKGFTRPAQDFALAHQISLIDLGGPAFDWLRTPIAQAAAEIDRIARAHGDWLPRGQLRTLLRQLLGTWSDPDLPNPATAEEWWPAQGRIVEVLAGLREELVDRENDELLLGFSSAPFVLALSPSDKNAFIRYAREHPVHEVGIRRIGSRPVGGNWELYPRADPNAYRLVFGLPERLEEWISSDERTVVQRARKVKSELLASLLIYRMEDDRPQVFQLKYAPAEVRAALS